MSIEHFIGTEGPTINVESVDEIYRTIDTLHTQVMDNFPEDDHQQSVLAKLESMMEDLITSYPDQINYM